MVLPARHRHLLAMATRKVACSCDSCALLFQNPRNGRFNLIPQEVRALSHFGMSDAEWEDLALPINMAFFFHNAPEGKVTALYPSPAGATESLIPLQKWEALAGLAPDVEALLVNRVGSAREAFIVPIDVCYELVGIIRLHWRGLHGGEEVWQEIDRFFARLKDAADPAREGHHA